MKNKSPKSAWLGTPPTNNLARQIEAKYRALFDSMDQGYCLIQMLYDAEGAPADWRYLEVNAAFEKHNGPANAVGRTVLELTPAIELKWMEIYGHVAATGEPVRFEEPSAARGRVFDVNAFRVGTPEDRQVAVLFTDITERRRSEENTRRATQRLQLILKSVIHYAIITTDLNGIIEGWNTGAENIFGYRAEDVIGQSCAIVFTTQDRWEGVPEREMQAALASGSFEDWRWLVRQDGVRFYSLGTITTIYNGEVEGFVKVISDQTSRLQTEKAVRDKEILQKLVMAQENERKRIARDLHDELGQELTVLRMQLENLQAAQEHEPKLSGTLDELQLTAKRIDDGVDFLSWELRPAVLDRFGLYAALEKYIDEWSHFSGVTAELLPSPADTLRLAPEAETNLYRIAQEAMNNISKHAQAKLVEVQFEKRADLVVLIIADDGIGFDLESNDLLTTNIGLIGMRERAQLIGGTIEIESQPGAGTTVYVRVPLTAVSEQMEEQLNDE